jgi:hypothetical protein
MTFAFETNVGIGAARPLHERDRDILVPQAKE